MLGRDIRRAWQSGVMHIGVSNFLTRLTSLAQRILLARILGAENIGHIAVVTSALSLIRLPAGAGTFTVVNKLMAENPNSQKVQKEIIGTSIRVNIVTTLIVGVLAWGILIKTSWLSDLVANRFLRTLILFLPLMIFSEIMKNALMGQRRMRAVAGIDIGLSLLAILVVVPMAYLWSIKGWFVNQILIIVVGVVLLAWMLRNVLSLKWNRAIAKKVATIGSFAFLGQLVGTLVMQFDTLSVSAILGNATLTGTYNTAALVAQQMIVVPGAVLTVVFPFVAQNKDNLPNLKKRYRELNLKIGGLAVGMTCIAWVACPWFFPIFGKVFLNSVAPFRVLALGFLAFSLCVLDNTYMDALGRTDITFLSGLLSAILAIVLNLTFIPKWGLMGAAWATTISMVVGLGVRHLAVQYFIFHKHAIR